MKPMLGQIEPGTIASASGFQEGDEILAINDSITPTWSEALNVLIESALDGDQDIQVKVKSVGDEKNLRVVNISEADVQEPEVLYERLGFKPWMPELSPIMVLFFLAAAMAAGKRRFDDIYGVAVKE
jgi:regulator of sigma E protease